MDRTVALARGYLPALALAILLIALVLGLTGVLPGSVVGVLGIVAAVLFASTALVHLVPTGTVTEPRDVAAPVTGRWMCLNSPTVAVPSHGTRGLGQSHAVDFLLDPPDGSRPVFGSGHGFRAPRDYPAFGQPVTAPVAGRVVLARDGARDHRSRTSWAGYAYLLVEGTLRDLAGPRFMIGNHVAVEVEPGCVAVLAHLQRGSVAVRVGDVVAVGDPLGRCGNSGNTSEPHVHAQLSTSARLRTADGLAFRFTDVRDDNGAPLAELPGNGGVFVAGP